MSFKSKITQDLINKRKQQKKEENKMKDSTKQTIFTVVITLLSVAALIAMFILGMNYEKSNATTVQKQVKEIVSSVKVDTPSKQ